MSNFKRKVNIVESTTPPTNPSDWWYDGNSDLIKRFTGGKWKAVNAADNGPTKDYSVLFYTSTDGKNVSYIKQVWNQYPILIMKNTDIPQKAFEDKTTLSSIFLPSGITSIGQKAFSGCTALKEVILPNTLTSIAKQAFSGCPIDSLTIPENIIDIAPDALPASTTHKISELHGPWVEGPFLIINNSLIYTTYLNPDGNTDIEIPNTVSTLAANSLGYLNGTEEEWYDEETEEYITIYTGYTIHIPNSVSSIHPNAFAISCDGIKAFNGKYSDPSGRWLVDGDLFLIYAGCYLSESLEIPNNIITINDRACQYAHYLTTIYCPETVTSIGQFAFYGISTLQEFYCKATIPPKLLNSQCFPDVDFKIYVPRDSVQAYKTATNWSKVASKIVGYDF